VTRKVSRGAWIISPVVAFAAYLAAAVAGFALESTVDSLPAFLAPGVGLAVLVRFGTGLWPAIWAGAFVAGLLRGSPAEVAALCAGLVALLGILAAHGLRRRGFRTDLSRIRDAVDLTVLGALAATGVTALLLALGLSILDPGTDTVAVGLRAWLGTGIGVLITAPPLLMWTSSGAPYRRAPREHPVETAFLLLMLLVACDAAFGGWLGARQGTYPLAFLPFPVLLWIGFRLGPLALMCSAAMASIAALIGTSLGLGPFAAQGDTPEAAVDWIFFAVSQATFLFLAAAIAEHAAAEEALRTEKERAEAATKAKSEFLSVMNHELRTPLNSILLAVDLLLESPLSRDQHELGKTVLRAGEALRVLVSETLDMARIEERRLELLSVDFSPRDLSRGVIDVFADAAHRKGVDLVGHVDPDVPPTLRGDAARLRQVLINLVGNALKFTEEGRIELRTGCRRLEPGVVQVRWEVSDTGAGIASEDRRSIFDPFTQADASSARLHGGTGLGLAISRRLAELMGGEIGVDSEIGVGSTFWVSVPLCTVPTQAEPAFPTARENVA